MKKYIFLSLLLLSACAKPLPKPEIILAKPIQVPELPSVYVKAERLPDINDPSLGGIMVDGVATDRKYNDIATKYNNLIDLFNCVRTTINTKELDKCIK